MTSMRVWLGSWVVFSVAALGLGACSSSNSPGGSGGTGGASSGGSGGAAGSAGTDGGSCHGDATKWATITQGPVSCTKNSDCCVVINGCVNQAQVVSKQAYDSGAAGLWPYCDNQCTECMLPAVDVVCKSGQCGLEQLDPLDASTDKSADHCGVDSMPALSPVKPKLGCM